MRVLIIEDEVDLASALRGAFQDEGYACDVAHDGREGQFELESWSYDLVVLDLMLPGIDGRTLLGRLREERRTPVLVLTARDALVDKVALLDTGADDYMTKPFQLEELLARARALIRRGAHEPRPVHELHDLRIDLAAREVRREGALVSLTPKEFALVELLFLRRGQIVTRTEIHERLYDHDDETLSNVVDVYVSNVRRKLGREFVRTRRGEGYIVDVPQ